MNKRKSILVTSGSKRLGKHISKFFVMNDWDLILHYNNSKVEAEETANELSLYSKNIKLYQADFTNYKDVENLVQNLLLKEKEWIGLVNNAGLFEYDTGQEFTIEKLNRHMSINFSTPAILIQALYKNIMKNQIEKNKNNMVINIIDAKIEGLNPDYYSYTLSKLAMSGLVLVLESAGRSSVVDGGVFAPFFSGVISSSSSAFSIVGLFPLPSPPTGG